MKPLILKVEELNKWREESWFEYAAETRDGIKIRLQCNCMGCMRVMKGKEQIWTGVCVSTAIERFHFC